MNDEMDRAIIKHKLDNIEMEFRNSREEFDVVKKLVYGLVFLVFFMVISSMIALVLPHEWWRPIVRMFK